jgi:hypothetical protein
MLLVTATVIAVYSAQQHKNLKERTQEGNPVSLQQRIISSGLEVVQNSRPVQEAVRCFKQPPLSPPSLPLQSPGYATGDAKQETGTRSTSMESTLHSQSKGSPQQSSSLRFCASLDTATSFRSDVRQEWINAVFGPDFPISPTTSSTNLSRTNTRQGVGLAQLHSYVSYDVSLPAHLEGDKLGISMTRLPLGLYVRSVKPGSEAWCAGVKLNSVLVSLNGMALLAEPSRQALERIWQYEGLCEDHPGDRHQESKSTGTPGNSSTAAGPSNTSDSAPSPMRIRDPVQMTFILHGKLYSVLLLSNPPYGIEWSPCGNFALVKRSYGHGASAGVKRGSIIAAINDTTMHDLDHTNAAAELREAFDAKEGIHLQLCFTPSAARSGHFETEFQNGVKLVKKAPRPQVVAQHDGVEVRVHPLLRTREESTSIIAPNSLTQLAIRVAAGELYSLPRTIQCYPKQKVYKPCPPLKSLLQHWGELDALLFCARYYLSDYNDQVVTIPDTTQDGLLHLCENDDASNVLGEFLLQFVSLICRPDGGSSDTHEYRVDRMDLRSLVLQVAKSDIDLTRQLELLLPAWGYSESLQKSLAELRSQMEQNELKEPPEEAAPRRSAATAYIALPESAASASNAPIHMDPSSCSSAEVQGMESMCTTSTSGDMPRSRTSPDVGSRGKKGGRRPRILGFFRKKKKVITRFSTTRPTTPTRDLSLSDHKTTLQTKQDTPLSSPPRHSKPTITTTMLTHTSSTSTNRHETLLVVSGASTRPRQELTHKPCTTVTSNDTSLPNSTLFANTGSFLKELESICIELEGSLLRSFSQKIAEWALQPWSASKGTAMAQVTQVMRERLGCVNRHQPLLNPIDTTEVLLSLDPTECYILPSAHFPWLLTFDCRERPLPLSPKLAPQQRQDSRESPQLKRERRRQSHSIFGREKLYRTKVELVSLNGDTGSQQSRSRQQLPESSLAFVVHGTVSGAVVESGRRYVLLSVTAFT